MEIFELKSNDEFFKTNFQEIMTELFRLLKYISRIENAPDFILPKIESSLENFNKILADSRKILEEINEKKQQVLDFLQNSQNYKESLQAYESLKQAYKQKFKDQESKILVLSQENENLRKTQQNFLDELQEKDFILENMQQNMKNNNDNLEKIETDRENLKKQITNFQSLIRQMNIERQNSNINSSSTRDENTRLIEVRIMEVREELVRTKDEYLNRLKIKDQTIENLQRRIDLLEKETALNEDWQFMKENCNLTKEKKNKKNK